MHAGNLSNIVQCNCSDYSVWKFGRIWICCEQILEYKGHCTAWVPKFSNVFFCFFLLVMFLSKFLPRMQKHRKSNLIRMFFWRTKVSEAVSKRDWHNMRSYLFFNMQKFRMEISDSVCNDLLANKTTFASDMFRVFVFGSHTKIKLTLLKTICLGYFLHLLVDLFKSRIFFYSGVI